MSSASPRRFLPVVVVVCLASGCSALIYEIVWLQLLQLVIGSSAVSLAVLLGTFMGGMCLGSLALPRVVSSQRHPLRVYGMVELGIGILGAAVWAAMPYVDRFYAGVYATGIGGAIPGMLLRGIVSSVCLLPPTLLMGASLPALARWMETTPRGVSWLGFLYGANIAGAVIGCVLAGFYLLRVHDTATATFTAVAINVAVASISLGLAAIAPYSASTALVTAAASTKPTEPRAPASGSDELALSTERTEPGSWPVYVAIALSGLCALGAEVIWTRLLSLMLGATVYTFSIILAGFLAGLGIGGVVGAFLARGTVRPRIALGCCQMLVAGAAAGAAYLLARSMPYWRVDSAFSEHPWRLFALDFGRCLLAIFPAACLWGASFPLALAAVARRGEDPGRLVGRVYASNTVGAITGAIGFSLLLIPGTGAQNSQRFLVGLSALAALVALPPLRWRIASLVAPIGLATLLAWNLPAVPWGVVAYGRLLPTKDPIGNLLYMGEGLNSSIAVSQLYNARMFHVAGKVEASTEPQDMRLQRMLGHIPALLHPEPRSVLVVGCGAGVTAGSLVVHPTVERIVICELEPLIPPAAARYFGASNHHVLRDRRTEVVFDDARHHILTTRDRFDVITSDPIHPWVKGSATLYTKEYFELCKRHLNPGGIITQWVPLYESTLDAVKSEIATFFQVFPHGTIWANETAFEEGYDLVLLGQAEATRIDVEDLERRLARADYFLVAQSLKELGFSQVHHLLATYAGQRRDLEGWLRDAQINQDRNLRLQYLAGMGPELQGALFIYEEMLRYFKFPEDLFVASEQRKQALRKALRRSGTR